MPMVRDRYIWSGSGRYRYIPKTISVGYVTTGEMVKEKRQQGLSVREIFAAQLQRFPALQNLSHEPGREQPRTTSFRCRVFANVAGPNWLVAGEAAAMVDPMTSNGVTAALRQGAEASSLIIRYCHRERLPRLPAAMYCQRVLSLARFFNSGIENVLYDWPIRNRIGAFNAGDLYTIPAWSMNVVYSRLRPRGLIKTTVFRLLLASLRYSAWRLSLVLQTDSVIPHIRNRVIERLTTHTLDHFFCFAPMLGDGVTLGEKETAFYKKLSL